MKKNAMILPGLVLVLTLPMASVADEPSDIQVTITPTSNTDMPIYPVAAAQQDPAVEDARRAIREALQQMRSLEGSVEERRAARRELVDAIREARRVLVESRDDRRRRREEEIDEMRARHEHDDDDDTQAAVSEPLTDVPPPPADASTSLLLLPQDLIAQPLP